MAQTTLTVTELVETMTGREELAVSQYFGRTLSDLSENDASMFGRALIFVAKLRDGLDTVAAGDFALDLMFKDTNTFFAEASEADEGKGEQPEPTLSISLSSAS